MPEQSLLNLAAPKFLDNALAAPAQEFGNTLANIFYVIFNPINYPAQKFRMKQSVNLKKFEADLQEELNKIPEENLTEPPLNIVGPALEASKFHIEEEEIRKMFAKLISSSMDIENSSFIHPSFVEIIKQMSSLDAINLKIVISEVNLPVVNYSIQDSEEKGSKLISVNNFLSNPDCNDMDLIRTSITNLNRLGLISIDFTTSFTDETLYDIFEESSEYNHLMTLKNQKTIRDFVTNKGVIMGTPLGKQFVKICVD